MFLPKNTNWRNVCLFVCVWENLRVWIEGTNRGYKQLDNQLCVLWILCLVLGVIFRCRVRNFASILETSLRNNLNFFVLGVWISGKHYFSTQNLLFTLHYLLKKTGLCGICINGWSLNFFKDFLEVWCFFNFCTFCGFLEFFGINFFLHLWTLTCSASDFVFRIDHDNALIQY